MTAVREVKFFVMFKGMVHFEINFWYVLAYLKGIQDVGVFVSAVVSVLLFLGQTLPVCQSYNGGLWSPPQMCTVNVYFHLRVIDHV